MFFRVQYETKINQIWYPVVRYDTAHGFAHRDLLNLRNVDELTSPSRRTDLGRIAAEVILLPEFDKELKEYNLRLGKNIESEDGKVVYIAIKNMRPKFIV
ncbi:MAG: hypothetical protein LWW98_08155 [Deltaproteobacteria bacterium]|nr:hypothetical protein [Deltaproteobacteria bacterium]